MHNSEVPNSSSVYFLHQTVPGANDWNDVIWFELGVCILLMNSLNNLKDFYFKCLQEIKMVQVWLIRLAILGCTTDMLL